MYAYRDITLNLNVLEMSVIDVKMNIGTSSEHCLKVYALHSVLYIAS